MKNSPIGWLSNPTNCCLKRRALHPNALPTWSIAAAGQLGNWANSNVKLLLIAHATVGMGLAPSVGEAALVWRIDRKNSQIEGIRPTFL